LRASITTVIHTVVDVDHLQTRLEHLDGRQDPLAVQAARIQAVGLEIGGGDKAHAVVKQSGQQAVQDHRIGDVGHMELIEADELVALRHPFAQFIERIDSALQLAQLAVHLAHELMKMQPRLALDRHDLIEAVHQKALAAADPAIQVNAQRNRWMADQLFEGIGTSGLVVGPLLGAALERCNRAQLRRVALVTPGAQFGFVGGADRHRTDRTNKKAEGRSQMRGCAAAHFTPKAGSSWATQARASQAA
jgi:hypothetical protein